MASRQEEPAARSEARAGKRNDPGSQRSRDLAFVHGPTEDGEGARIIRCRDGELLAGEVRPLKEGQAVNEQTLVRLRPVEPSSPVCEVEVVHDPAEAQGAQKARHRAGPAQVATDTYRRNWQQVFAGGKLGRGLREKGNKASAAGAPPPGKGKARPDFSIN
ncbi:MAG: hypothetical protein OXU20_05345 [Myxococcales bacterium]|nr:hypothetical protein [Myxococcales bacterium]